MKKTLLTTVLLLCFASLLQAQIVVSSTTATTTKEQLKSYRGYIEASGIFGTKGRAGFMFTTAHGIQFSPRIWGGIGIGVSKHKVKVEKFFPTPPNNSNFYFYGYEHKVIRKYRGDNVDKNLTFPIFAEIKVNLLKNDLALNNIKSLMPYISTSIGGAPGDEAGGCYWQLKFGATGYNINKTIGISAFAAFNVLPYYYRQTWKAYYKFNWYENSWEYDTSYHDEDASGYCLLFNIGVSFEFGGNAGFKARAK